MKVSHLDMGDKENCLGGDSLYIREARKIQDNVAQLTSLAAKLKLNAKELPADLREAKRVAIKTHKLLKAFGNSTSADCYGTEKSLRRQTHKKLNLQYQAALRSIDSAAVAALERGAEREKSPPTRCREKSLKAAELPSVEYPERLVTQLVKSHTAKADDESSEVEAGFSMSRTLRGSYAKDRVQQSWKVKPAGSSYAQPLLNVEMRDVQQDVARFDMDQPVDPGSQEKFMTYSDMVERGFPVRILKEDELYTIQLQEKARGVLQVEKDVRGIRELYKEMAWQVNNFSDDLDAVESQIHTASAMSGAVVDKLDAARTLSNSRFTRMQCFVLGCGLFLCIYWFFFT